MWWPTVCRRKDRCCQPETPVCDLAVWCDFIGARHLFARFHPALECLASRGCEDTRGTEIDIATSVSFQRVDDRCDSLRSDVLVSVVALKTLRAEFWASSHGGDDFCEGLSHEQMRLHFPLHVHERTDANAGEGPRRNQGRALGALDGHSEQHAEEQRGADSGLGWCAVWRRLPFVDLFHPEFSDRNHLLAYSELFVSGFHGPTSNGGPGKRASSIVRLGLTQVMYIAMGQFECALAAGQLNIAGRVCRTLPFLGENTDMPMVRGRFSEASQIFRPERAVHP